MTRQVLEELFRARKRAMLKSWRALLNLPHQAPHEHLAIVESLKKSAELGAVVEHVEDAGSGLVVRRYFREKLPAAEVTAGRAAAPERLQPRRGRLREALELMASIPEPEGTDAAWEAVERGIREARDFPGREP